MLILLFIICIPLILIGIRAFMRFTIARCDCNDSMEGKTVIVTGANSNIGFYTAKNLAARGARIIIACRNNARGTTAAEKIITQTGNRNVIYRQLNLSSLDSVRKFAANILESETRLDVLINNAGVHGYADIETEDGIVEGMQVNHFGPFLLTLLLLPLLKKTKPSRIINLSSILHFFGRYDIDLLNTPGSYNETMTYSNGKLCNVLFTVELAKRLRGSGVVVNSVHPGVIKTHITDGSTLLSRFLFTVWCWICCRTPEEGAQTVVHLAVARNCESVSGKYFYDCKERFMTWKASNSKMTSDLWKLSEKLVGYTADLDI